MTSLLIMSLRGRVIKRGFQTPNCPASSYREQMNKYIYLAKVLHIGQYTNSYWLSCSVCVDQLKAAGKLPLVKSVFPSWSGPSTQRCIQLPVQMPFMFNMFWANAGGTVLAEGLYEGFLYQNDSGQWSNRTALFTSTETTVPASSVLYWSLGADRAQPIAFTSIGTQHEADVGSWLMNGSICAACYYVTPLFSITVHTNAGSTNAQMIYQETLK